MQHVRNRPARWPWLLVAVAVAASAWWLLRPSSPPQAQAPAPAGTRDGAGGLSPPSLPEDGAVPAIQHPLAPPEHVAADAPIPHLADSDATVFAELGALVEDRSVFGILLREHLVQRLVVMVDNLTEPRVTSPVLALRPPPDQYASGGRDGVQVADVEANTSRYAAYVAAFTTADPERVADAYRRFYPLFQEAYAELGRPDGYFNDRLVQVIDHLLQAPGPPAGAELMPDERGRMRYVDPALESASVGHKALMRLSPRQQAAVKDQLRALRQALASP